MVYIEEIKIFLNRKAEENYRKFSSSLINGSSMPLIGVRLPILKNLAAEICAAGKGEEFLADCDFSSIEMSLLYAYALGRIKGEPEKLILLFRRVVYRADNWASCDTLCQSFKQCRKWRDVFFKELVSYFETEETFIMRAGAVLLLSHYLEDGYIDRVFELIDTYKNDGYYYKMGAAWCIATAMAKYPEKTYVFLRKNRLDDITYNTAIRKMIESRRIPDADKLILKGMRR